LFTVSESFNVRERPFLNSVKHYGLKERTQFFGCTVQVLVVVAHEEVLQRIDPLLLPPMASPTHRWLQNNPKANAFALGSKHLLHLSRKKKTLRGVFFVALSSV
jgi:hypothetical protein